MVQFHRVTIGDKPFVDKFVFVENSRSADFNFGNIYLWDTAYFQFLSCCLLYILKKYLLQHYVQSVIQKHRLLLQKLLKLDPEY